MDDIARDSIGLTGCLLAVALLAGGCITYSAGTTAQPVGVDKLLPYTTVTYVPTGASANTSTTTEDEESAGYFLPSIGARYGIDSESELQLTAPGIGGFLVGYKRRVIGADSKETPALAVSGSAGVVNAGYHAYLQATVIASGPEYQRKVVPYGGLRAMHVLPLNETAVSDLPTFGGFVGVRLGSNELGISPEIGIFYDSPALDLREHNIIVVPGITLHGDELFGIFD